MCEDEYDDYDNTESAILTLNVREIFKGDRELFPGDVIITEPYGYITNYGAKAVFTNIDLQKVLGDMYNRYEVFSIDLKSITSALCDVVNSLDAMSSNKFKSISIYLEGFDFCNNRGVLKENIAHITNISEQYDVNNNEYIGEANWWHKGRFLKEVQEDESPIFFRKHAGLRPISILIGSINENEPISDNEPQIVYSIHVAPTLFCQFQIKPVK